MPPGKYKVQAELQGFSSVVVPEVELLVGQNATVPFVLKLASLSETVTITGESPLVDISSSQVAGNVDRRQMEELPLQGPQLDGAVEAGQGHHRQRRHQHAGRRRDDMFQLNLDGQQITQKIAGSGFGQPRFSREAIAEFQIITNMFDITQGRSAGIQVQAISKSGTNTNSGSFYGFFRDDKLNAADAVANKVLPYSNQQIGGTFGGPIVKDKLHYFASYEYEREPGTFFSSPSTLPGQTFTVPYKNGQKSFLARVDDQFSSQQPAVVSRIALGLEQPVRARRQRSSVERVGADQGGDEHSRQLVARRSGQQQGARDQRRLQQLRLDQCAAAVDGRVRRSTTFPDSRLARPTTSRSTRSRTTSRRATT